MKNVKVSICCLTYNQGKYIRQCLDGFLMQKTDFPFEIIVHDDCSTDDTADILKEYEAKYPDKLHVLYEKENQYSKGIQMEDMFLYPNANGEYIALCEGDDFWNDPNKLQKQVEFLDVNPEYGMCYSDYNVLYQQTGVVVSDFYKNHPNFKCEYLSLSEFIPSRAYMAPPSWLFRKSYCPTPAHKIRAVDGSFVDFAYFLSKTKIKFFNEAMVTYRVLEESACHSLDYERMFEREQKLLRIQLYLCDEYKLDSTVKEQCYQVSYRRNLIHYILNDKIVNLQEIREKYKCPNSIEKLLLFLSVSPFGRRLIKVLYNLYRKLK